MVVRALLPPVVCAALAALHAAAEEFPYRGVVRTDGVYVRSGPGQSYYPTQQLRAGDVVEVYRHDPGGWLAIRPPQGSFTWVAAHALQLIEPDIAVVTTDDVLARVGSALTDERDVWHVKLRSGEEVLVLERPEAPTSGSGGWYKIAPPAGEFRWVAAQDIERLDDAARAAGPAASPSGSPQVASGAASGAEAGAAFDAPSDRRAAVPSMSTTAPQDGDFEQRCAALDLELSAVVSQELGTWSLQALRRGAEQLRSAARSASQRALAQRVLDKIEHFDHLQQRIVQLDRAIAQSDRRLASLPRAAAAPPSVAPAEDAFDASGELVPVRSTRFGAPQYVVLDETGAVQCYVTAAPGVHLRPYQGRRVGIIGARDFLPDLRAPHVTARQVRVLDGGALR